MEEKRATGGTQSHPRPDNDNESVSPGDVAGSSSSGSLSWPSWTVKRTQKKQPLCSITANVECISSSKSFHLGFTRTTTDINL